MISRAFASALFENIFPILEFLLLFFLKWWYTEGGNVSRYYVRVISDLSSSFYPRENTLEGCENKAMRKKKGARQNVKENVHAGLELWLIISKSESGVWWINPATSLMIITKMYLIVVLHNKQPTY